MTALQIRPPSAVYSQALPLLCCYFSSIYINIIHNISIHRQITSQILLHQNYNCLLLSNTAQPSKSMQSSNAFSDYMLTSNNAVNRSINNAQNRSTTNLSPTSGKLHKNQHQGSFGPTICLLNRSRDVRQSRDTEIQQTETQAFCEKIFLLMLEIDRLNLQIKKIEKHQNTQNLQEYSLLKVQNQHLLTRITQFQQWKLEQNSRHNQNVYSFKEKINTLDAENRNLNRRLKQTENQFEEQKRKRKEFEETAEKAKFEASKMSMSILYNNTNTDLQKSIAKQRALQIQSLRQKISKCQDVINEQRFIIANQNEQINKQKNYQVSLQQQLEVQIEHVQQQTNYKEKQTLTQLQQERKFFQLKNKEAEDKYNKMQEEVFRKNQLLQKSNKNMIALEEKCLEYEKKYNDIEFASHSQIIKSDQNFKLAIKEKQREIKNINHEFQQIIAQVEMLKNIIEEQKHQIEKKQSEIRINLEEYSRKIHEKDSQMRNKIERKKNNPLVNENKTSKSHSVENNSFQNKLRNSTIDLEKIVSSVLELKNSNQRTEKLIGKTVSNAHSARQIYYYGK